MRLKTKTDYCIRVLIHLQKMDSKLRIQDIADALQVSKNHLSVAVNKLSELGYIHSTQGPKGGIEFNYSAGDRTVAELISKVEDFQVVECFDPANNLCTLSSNCKLKGMLAKSTTAFLDELKKYKIKDLI
ncbi:Rrf2 family transcriptional regulator [Halobacteriovorax sp. HLS]|uniref:RrF2 family transcriptional regulator n=1 Tax=Halobacteriovorax sp. HLS TaxID=2234000 RepID=UPI000FD71354|nr:Rrf2 family transcriptional regulator [Halobacteriovorax sp. HLS]